MKAATFIALIYISLMSFPAVLLATSYPPPQPEQEPGTQNAVLKAGSTAYMFYSEAEKNGAITINDTIPVYREDRFSEMQQVGKIKVLSQSGENYYSIVVIEGAIQNGDIARKNGISFLIILQKPGSER